MLNSRERPTLDDALARELQPLPLDEVLAHHTSGAQLLDTRDPSDFAATHVAGSINVGLCGQYASWAGTVLSRERPIVIIADPGRETESAVRLGRIGFDHVIGYLTGGLRSLEARPDLTRTTDRLSAEVAARRLSSTNPPLGIDVRTAGERGSGYIPATIHVPLNHMMERVRELPRDRPLLVYCAGGYRSSIAVSLLHRDAFTDVSEIAGGMAAWQTANLPVATVSQPAP